VSLIAIERSRERAARLDSFVLQEVVAMKLCGNFHSVVLSFVSATLAAVLGLGAAAAFAGSAFAAERVIYNFTGGNDGIGSNDLIADRAGNLFGTTFNGGGSAGAGTVYEISPPVQPGGAWTETILFSFSYAALDSGIGPLGRLVMDSAGNLYGTTWLGGPQGGGVAFELSPPAVQGGAWTYSLLYAFGGAGLSSPELGLALDKAGNLYGTTASGGTGACGGGCGGVFKLAPPSQPGGAWTETVLFNFSGTFETGGGTSGGLTMDARGALYGTTYRGSGGQAGTVFRLTPPNTKGGHWTHTVLYAFAGFADGADPQAEVVFDKNGNLYGVTSYGGSGGPNCFGSPCGTVFQLTPTPTGPWTHTVLYSLNGGTDSGYPERSLTLDAAGNLFGTAGIGGDPSCTGGNGDGCGTVFRLAPPAVQGGSWTETILHRFAGGTDGVAAGGLTSGKGRLLYGPAAGGANNDGLVFALTP
jgi:uncharacterized repeat protein (TIGR03803 family)